MLDSPSLENQHTSKMCVKHITSYSTGFRQPRPFSISLSPVPTLFLSLSLSLSLFLSLVPSIISANGHLDPRGICPATVYRYDESICVCVCVCVFFLFPVQAYAKASAERKAAAEARVKVAVEIAAAKELKRQQRREAKQAAKEAEAQAAVEAAALERSLFVASSNPLEYVNRYGKAIPYPGMPVHKEADPPLELSQESHLWHAWPLGAVDVPHPLLPGDPVESPAQGEALVACAHLEPVARLLLQLQKSFGGLLYGTQWRSAWGIGGEWPMEVRAADSVQALGRLAQELMEALHPRAFRESWQMPYELKLSRAYKSEVEAAAAAVAAREAAAEAQARRVAAAAARELASRQLAEEREKAAAEAAAAAAVAKEQEMAAAAAAAGMSLTQFASQQQQQQARGSGSWTAASNPGGEAFGASPNSGLANGEVTVDTQYPDSAQSSPAASGVRAGGAGSSNSPQVSAAEADSSAEFRSPKKQRRRSSRPSAAPGDFVVPPALLSPPRSGRGKRKASLSSVREAFGVGSAGGMGDEDDDDDAGLAGDPTRMNAGLDHSKMSDAAFDRMLADMEADRSNERSKGGGKAAKESSSFPPQGYFDSYQKCEWRVRCFSPGVFGGPQSRSQGHRAGSMARGWGPSSAAAAAAALLPPPPPPPYPTSSSKQLRRTRRRHHALSASAFAASELGIGETVLRGWRYFPVTSRKPPPTRLARAMARRGTHRPISGFCYVSPSGTTSAAVDGAKVPVSALWHARVARCRSAAELAVHLRSVQVVIDADLVEQATSSSPPGAAARGGARGGGGGGGATDQINVASERWNSAAGVVEVLLKVWAPGRRVRVFVLVGI